jgi:aspartyl-tRNA synthetase
VTKTSYLINQSNEHGKYYRFIEEYITIKHCFRDIDTSRYTQNKFHQVSAHIMWVFPLSVTMVGEQTEKRL